MEAAPDPKDATDFRFRQLSKVKLVSDGGNEAIINPAENSQRLAISNKLGLVFAGKRCSLTFTAISGFFSNTYSYRTLTEFCLLLWQSKLTGC